MGGCIAGKPENCEDSDGASGAGQVPDKQETLDLANRRSFQVYCGESKKTDSETQDKPPGNPGKTEDVGANGDIKTEGKGEEFGNSDIDKAKGMDKTMNLEHKVSVKKKDTNTSSVKNSTTSSDSTGETKSHIAIANQNISQDKAVCATQKDPLMLQTKGNSSSTTDGVVEHDRAQNNEEESADTVSPVLPSPTIKKLSHPGLAVYSSSVKIVKRPRSFDSACSTRPLNKNRPLSYSPGPLKTKHPRSLHSINEVSQTLPRERPRSMDISAFFEAKGIDIHSQKMQKIAKKLELKQIQADNVVCRFHIDEDEMAFGILSCSLTQSLF